MKNTEQNQKSGDSKKCCTIRSDDGELVDIQLESFWGDRPSLWFKKIEAQLAICFIEEDERKFNFVVSLLDQETVMEVKHIIMNPPADDKYDALKNELIDRITFKNEQKAKEKLSTEKLGNRKPSEFYDHIKCLTGSCYQDNFIQDVWINCLPAKIRSVLKCIVACEYDDIELMIKVADCVQEILQSPPETQSKTDAPSSSSIECLMKQVEDLNRQIHLLKPKAQQGRSRSKVRNVPHIGGPVLKADKDTQKGHSPCRYHTKYGIKFCKLRPGVKSKQ